MWADFFRDESKRCVWTLCNHQTSSPGIWLNFWWAWNQIFSLFFCVAHFVLLSFLSFFPFFFISVRIITFIHECDHRTTLVILVCKFFLLIPPASICTPLGICVHCVEKVYIMGCVTMYMYVQSVSHCKLKWLIHTPTWWDSFITSSCGVPMTVHYHTHTTTQPLVHTHTHKLHMVCYETSNTLLAQGKHPFKPLSKFTRESLYSPWVFVCERWGCLFVVLSSCEDQLKEMSRKIHYTCIVLSI